MLHMYIHIYICYSVHIYTVFFSVCVYLYITIVCMYLYVYVALHTNWATAPVRGRAFERFFECLLPVSLRCPATILNRFGCRMFPVSKF